MSKRVFVFAFVLGAISTATNWNRANFDEIVQKQNSRTDNSWKAGLATNLNYDDPASLAALCGAKVGAIPVSSEPDPHASHKLQSLPTSFDLRAQYPKCWSISHIRDQGQCGGCWAVASASALSDRYCIKYSTSTVLKQKHISAEDILECCSLSVCGTGPNKGCNGGYMDGAYSFVKTNGASTGENYQNYTTCKPWAFPHYSANAVAPSCSSTCANTTAYKTPYANDKTKISSYTIYSTQLNPVATVVNQIQTAIYTLGSVTAYLTVYNEFFAYKSGVYVPVVKTVAGGHAVRIIGWGVSPTGQPYWIVQNSWGAGWGMSGTFWILRGSNAAKIEYYVVAGTF